MSARHRISKLLLRKGIVYYGGKAWTAKHKTWLRPTASTNLSCSWPTTLLSSRCF